MSTDEDTRISDCFSGVHADPMDVLPRALPTKMTVLSTVRSDYSRNSESPTQSQQQVAKDANSVQPPSEDAPQSPPATPRSPCHPMCVDYPESDDLKTSEAGKVVAFTKVNSGLVFPFLWPVIYGSCLAVRIWQSVVIPYDLVSLTF